LLQIFAQNGSIEDPLREVFEGAQRSAARLVAAPRDQAFPPPSTVRVEPVMYFALALARNATASAMSSGAP
jgi:hypothetical protein